MARGLVSPQTTWSQAEREEPAPILSRQAQLVIETTREMNPQTSIGLFKAVLNLLNVGANAEARVYFDKLLAKTSSNQSLAAIHQQMGSAAVVRLAREPTLAPEGVALSRRITTAANRAARDPKRLAALITKLESESLDDRLSAAHKLGEGREQAAAALLQAMADPDRQRHLARYRIAWKRFDQSALPPVLAALRCDDAALQYAALLALGELEQESGVPSLIGYLAVTQDGLLRETALRTLRRTTGMAGMPSDAAAVLRREAERRLTEPNEPPFFPVDPASDRRLPVWSWAPITHRPTVAHYPPRTAELMQANRMAHDLARLESGNDQLYRVSELALLEALNRASTTALIEMAQQRSTATGRPWRPLQLLESLNWALERSVDEAAVAACTLLGQFGDERILHTGADARSPLAAAMRSTNRHVRDAAALAIMQIQPTQPFLGAADLVPIALAMTTADGSRRALVIHPVAAEAGNVAGLLAAASWESEAVSTGKEAIRRLLKSDDFELILLSDAVREPRYTELLQQLRFDRRTAEIPLVVISRRGELNSVRALVAPLSARNPELPAIDVYPFPSERGTLSVLLKRAASSELSTSSTNRQTHAKAAIDWFSRVTSDLKTYSFYELSQYDHRIAAALWNPELAASAAQALGHLGTATAQTALRRAIDSYPPDSDLGKAVRSAFSEAVRRRGAMIAP